MIKMATAVVRGNASASSYRPSEKAAFDGGLRSSLIFCTRAGSSCSVDCHNGGNRSGGIKSRKRDRESRLPSSYVLGGRETRKNIKMTKALRQHLPLNAKRGYEANKYYISPAYSSYFPSLGLSTDN